jgi:hypothetical protein
VAPEEDCVSYLERMRGPQEPTNVVPINGIGRPAAEGLHPYAAAIREAWVNRLTDLAGRPWKQGDAWDTNCFVSARKLIELANSPWAGYSHADAREDYLTHAPRDHAWDQREKCWSQAEKVASSVMLPPPPPREEWVVPDVTVLDAEVGAAETNDLAELIRHRFPLLDFTDLLGSDDDGEEWIVEPVLAARRLVALYSAPKVGKSLLMLEIAVGIALGREVIGVTPEKRRVLYVDFENDPRGDIRRRLEAMGFGPDEGPDLNAGLCYLSFPSLAKLDTSQGGFELLSTAQEYGCEVVVIDTVSRAVGGEENDNDTWLAFYRDTGMLLKGAGIACIRLDHSGKDAEKGMRGGSAKYGDVDAVWKLTADSETVLNLDCTDHRMPVEHPNVTLVREAHPVLHHRLIGDRIMALDYREKEIDQEIDRLGIDTSCTSANETYKRLRDAGRGFNKQSVFRVVKARKMRLDEPPPGGSGTTLEQPGTTPGGSGSRSPLRSRAPEPPQGNRFPEPEPPLLTDLEDPDLLVSCKSCFKPTTNGVASKNDGRCYTCATEAGLEIT